MPGTPKISPAALVAFVLSPIVLVIAVLAAIAGALLWFGIASPLAIAAGVIVLALAAAIFYGGVYLARRRDERAVDATITGMTDAIGAQDNTPQARERVAKLRAKWERKFRHRDISPEYIKSKPILMIMGESKSGKSVLLDRSGLELESGNRQERDWEEGTENVDPWFFPDGLVLDTAGEMLVSAAGGARIDWSELVKLIKTLRPRNPVSGVILAVPVWRLQSDDEGERIKQANLIQREFQRLVQSFGVRFPVSVVVTMADLIDGYSEFALRQSAARPGDKYTILGWPQYQLSDEFGGRDVMAESVSGVTARIDAQVLYDTCNPETAAAEGVEALEIWCLPKHIRTIGQRLADYLKLVFKEKQSERVANAPFFRGIFFGSAMQAIRKGEPRRKEPERPRSEPFNIRDLLAIRLFGEAGLVTTSPRAEAAARTRRLVGVVVPVAVAAVSAGVALVALGVSSKVKTQKDALVRIDASALWKAPWITKDGKLTHMDHETGKDQLAEAFGPESVFTVDLSFPYGWYAGFAQERVERAAKARQGAWTVLVAMPLLEAAASERAWSTVGGAYRARELEKIDAKRKAALLNPDLLSLDQGLVAALQAAGAKPDGLKLLGEAAKKAVPESAATPSLAPLLRAMTGQVPSNVDKVLAVENGWLPPARAAELAADALKLHERFLEDKFATAVKPLVLAADTHAAWSNGKVNLGGEGDLTWETVKGNVWGLVAELDKSNTSPSSRLDTLASWIDLPGEDAKERIIGLFGNGGRAREFGQLGDEKRQLTQRIKDLDTLFERTADFPGIVDSVVTRAEEVQNAGYEPGSLRGTIELDLAALVDRPSTESKSEAPEAAADVDGVADEDGGGEEGGEEDDLAAVSKYAKPAIEHFVEKVASFLGDKVVAAQAGIVTQPSSRPDGVLAPISDFGNVNAASLRAYDDDGVALKDWRNNSAWKKWRKLSDDRFKKAEDNLKKLASEVSNATKGWAVVATSGFGPAEAATVPFVEAVLQNGDKTVDQIAVEVAEQAARLAGSSDDDIRKARESARKTYVDRDQLREALKRLVAEASRSGSAGGRAGAARFVANLSPSTQSSGQDDPFTVISNGVKAVASLQSPDEKLYWQHFWRDVLMEAARLRDDDQDAADRIVRTTGAGFPLSSSEGADPVSPSAVLKLAGIGTASQPGGATNLKPADRRTAGLDELLNHRRPAAERTTAQADAIKIAALLAKSEGGPVREAVALRLSVRATGDWGLLRELGAVAEFAPNRAEADSATRIKQQLLLERAASQGVERVSCQVTPDFDPSEKTLFEWPLGDAADRSSSVQPGLSVTFANGELGDGREQRQDLSLDGGAWSALRLARELSPIGQGEQALANHEGFAWGAIRVVDLVEGADRTRELYVALGLKLEWVLNDGTTQPVDIAAWLREIKKSK